MAATSGLPPGIGPPSSPTLPPSSSSTPRSFAAALGIPATTDFNPTAKFTSIEGIPFVDFEPQDLSRAANSFRLALVMKFMPFQRPSVDLIRNQAKKFWGLHKEVKVSLLDGRHVLLRFNHEQDMIKILSKESSRLNGASYKIIRWSPEFDPKHDVSIAPVWIQLKDLPPHMYHSSFLRNISKPIGQYLRSDSATLSLSNTTRARICVEVDVLKPLPTQIWVRTARNKRILQPVLYEEIPKFCISCKMQGHNEVLCHKLHPELKKKNGFVCREEELKKQSEGNMAEKTAPKVFDEMSEPKNALETAVNEKINVDGSITRTPIVVIDSEGIEGNDPTLLDGQGVGQMPEQEGCEGNMEKDDENEILIALTVEGDSFIVDEVLETPQQLGRDVTIGNDSDNEIVRETPLNGSEASLYDEAIVEDSPLAGCVPIEVRNENGIEVCVYFSGYFNQNPEYSQKFPPLGENDVIKGQEKLIEEANLLTARLGKKKQGKGKS